MSAGALGAFSDTDRIDSVFIQPASNNQFICEACTLCLPRSELLEHRSAKYHLVNVHRLRDNPAFDMSEIAAAKGARVEALVEQLGRKAAGNATSTPAANPVPPAQPGSGPNLSAIATSSSTKAKLSAPRSSTIPLHVSGDLIGQHIWCSGLGEYKCRACRKVLLERNLLKHIDSVGHHVAMAQLQPKNVADASAVRKTNRTPIGALRSESKATKLALSATPEKDGAPTSSSQNGATQTASEAKMQPFVPIERLQTSSTGQTAANQEQVIVIDAGPENEIRTSKPEIDPAPVVLSSVRAKGAAAAKPIKTPAPKRNTTSTIRRKPTAKAASRTPVYKVAAAVQTLNLHTEMREAGNQTQISGNESVCISTHHFYVLDGAYIC